MATRITTSRTSRTHIACGRGGAVTIEEDLDTRGGSVHITGGVTAFGRLERQVLAAVPRDDVLWDRGRAGDWTVAVKRVPRGLAKQIAASCERKK